MENSQLETSYNTWICEGSHSKRIIVEALAGLRSRLSEPVYRVRGDEVSETLFTGVQNLNGCVVLTGCGVEGVSLLGYCLSHGSGAFRSDRSEGFLAMLLALIRAALLLRGRTGRFPQLYPNGCHFDERDGAVTFFPPSLSDFLSAHLADEEQRGVYYIAGADVKGERGGEEDFVRSIGRLIYFYFTRGNARGNPIGDRPAYFLSELVPGMPRQLSDAVWRITRGKQMGLDALAGIVERAFDGDELPRGGTPFFKRSRVVGFTHAFRGFFAARYKLVIAGILVLGILAYILADFIEKRGRQDFTRGLGPKSVVELYYTAMDRLDLELLSSLLYKRAGRKTLNELSTLYVMSRYEQVLGRKSELPEANSFDANSFETNAPETGVSAPRLFSIEGLVLEQEASGDEPVFRARYLKVVNTVEKEARFETSDTLTLRKIGDRWYIVKIVQDEGSDRGLVE